MTPILTDAGGRPLARPERKDFADVVLFIRARHAHNDRITEIANAAFQHAFARAMPRRKTMKVR